MPGYRQHFTVVHAIPFRGQANALTWFIRIGGAGLWPRKTLGTTEHQGQAANCKAANPRSEF